jgi:hypothetical protein
MSCQAGTVPGYEDETSVLIYRNCFYWNDEWGWLTTSIPDHWYTPPKSPEQLAAMAMTKAVNAAQMAEAENRNKLLMEKLSADLKVQEDAAKADQGLSTSDAIRQMFKSLSDSMKQPLSGSYWVKYKWFIDNWTVVLTVIGILLTLYGITSTKEVRKHGSRR